MPRQIKRKEEEKKLTLLLPDQIKTSLSSSEPSRLNGSITWLHSTLPVRLWSPHTWCFSCHGTRRLWGRLEWRPAGFLMISLVRISLLFEASRPAQFTICIVFLHSDVKPYHLKTSAKMCNSFIFFFKLKVMVATFFIYWRRISEKRNSKTFPSCECKITKLWKKIIPC